MSFLILTGCSVKYNIVINEDLTINEEARLTATKKNVIKSFLNQYKDILDQNKYNYELVEQEIPYVKVYKKYNDINSYINESILFNDYFDEIKYTSDGNHKKIETIGFNENNSYDPNRFDVKELTISITCPFKVSNHNAKRVDKKTNTYYYELNSDNSKILLEFNSGKKYNRYEDIIIIILICLAIIACSWIVIYILNRKKNK